MERWIIALAILALVSLIVAVPDNAEAQEIETWDTYESVWVEINYYNITSVWIKHAVSGSLVAEGQKLNFVVVPIDVDEYSYVVKVYKNDILMYTFTKETVNEFSIYMTNPNNQIVNIRFTLDDVDVLTLEYWAILMGPSVDYDYTAEWLRYQQEKRNESLSGLELVNLRDKALSDINLVATTGFWAMVLAIVASVIVVVFQLIRIFNIFTFAVWMISALIFVHGIAEVDAWVRDLPMVTAGDVIIYYSNIITIGLIILIANIFFVFSYVITSTRLEKKRMLIFNPKERKMTEYEAVIGRKRGKVFWRLQDSWSAIRRVFWGVDYEIDYGYGDITDSYEHRKADPKYENIGTGRSTRALKSDIREQIRQIKTRVRPTPKVRTPKSPESIASKLGTTLKRIKGDNPGNPVEKPQPARPMPREYKKRKTLFDRSLKKRNLEIWTMDQGEIPLSQPTPVIVVQGQPEFIQEYEKKEYTNILEQLRAIEADTKEPKALKQLQKKIKKVEKQLDTPKAWKVRVRLANAEVYNIIDWMTQHDTFDRQARMINKLRDMNNELQMKLAVEAYTHGQNIYDNWEKTYDSWVEMMKSRELSLPEGE